MALTLYMHPLASFCHKVLIALYENATPFTPHIVDFADEQDAAQFLAVWPVGKIPVLHDSAKDRTLPETTIIIEYLEQFYPGARPLLPRHKSQRLEARLWDRFFDLYVQVPMQKIVGDRLRPEEARDPHGVAEARAALGTAYEMIERQLDGREWALGDGFGIADCAAAPALFYAGFVEPFPAGHVHLAAYVERLTARPSVRRVLEEARPYFRNFPYHEAMPARYLEDADPA